MDWQDIQIKSDAELAEMLSAARVELQQEKAKVHAKQLKQFHKLAIIRKNIARINFLLSERKKAAVAKS